MELFPYKIIFNFPMTTLKTILILAYYFNILLIHSPFYFYHKYLGALYFFPYRLILLKTFELIQQRLYHKKRFGVQSRYYAIFSILFSFIILTYNVVEVFLFHGMTSSHIILFTWRALWYQKLMLSKQDMFSRSRIYLNCVNTLLALDKKNQVNYFKYFVSPKIQSP